MTVKALRSLNTKCQSVFDANDVIFKPVAEKMLFKLHKYDACLCKDIFQLVGTLDPRFGSEIYLTVKFFVIMSVCHIKFATSHQTNYLIL